MKKKKFLFDLAITAILLIETAFAADLMLTDIWGTVGIEKVCIAALVLFCVYILICHFLRKLSIVLASLIPATLLFAFIGFRFFLFHSVYRQADTDMGNVFAGHKVMLIVPHEDDDINVLGGIFEQYVDHGSEVYTVFVTNGDYVDLGKVRINEAIACMEKCGVPEDHVIFLGYGDQWDSSGPHIYNAPSDTVIKSHIGYTQTYSTDSHPAYRSSEYTSDNYFNDLKSVILETRPDTVYCVDYDGHVDHRAVSLAFEKVFGQILSEFPDYRPTVLKGFAYGTAWTAAADFYSVNILSTINPGEESEHMPYGAHYRWGDRLRLPVKAALLSRSLEGSEIYKELAVYASQNAANNAKRIINGDKVFWERSTSSLSYTAEVSASSGNAELINDFMLFDSSDLVNGRTKSDGIWIPDADDADKSITLTLDTASDIDSISLYDNPYEEDNILSARIILDNGKEFNVGALDKYGAATSISIGEKNIKSVTVVIEST